MSDTIFETDVNVTGLRKCQKEAYEAILQHFSQANPERNVIVELPTGTGKTGLLAVTPFKLSKKKVLILTPNLKLAKDVADNLDIVKYPDTNIYKKIKIFTEEVLENLELFVLKLEGSINKNDLLEHQIIVANYHQLQDLEKWFQGNQELVDVIIIDEAHHQAAETYQEILKYFPSAKVIGLTATPFRSDGKRIDGKTIYKYHFHDAIQDGIIRNIKISNVAPEEIELSFSDSGSKKFTLEQVLKFKEEAWFNKGIALSQDCCDSIARKAKEKLEELQKEFPNESHQIIASAISKRHAREFVKPAFEKLGLKVGMVSSDGEDVKQNDGIFKKLSQGKLDVIVHIGMLGEGFDHPPLGVAAIFRPYKSLNPYIQFLGRAIRSNGSTRHCHVVSHLGLNQLQRFNEFKMFDYEDQKFMQELFTESPKSVEDQSFIPDTKDKQSTETDEEDTLTITEIGNETLEFQSQFLNESSDINEIIEKMSSLDEGSRKKLFEKLGIDPSQVKLSIKKKSTRLKPVEQRKASKNLLNERGKSITIDILKELGLTYTGRDFNKMFKNFVWVTKRVSKSINESVGIKSNQRKEITNEQFKQIEESGALDSVYTDNLQYYRKKLSELNSK